MAVWSWSQDVMYSTSSSPAFVSPFCELRNSPGRNTAEVEKFRGAVDLITLGNVYFDKKRTIAAVYVSAYCGSLCAFGTWRVFLKTSKGDWDEQKWARCMIIASTYPSALRSSAFADRA